MPQRQTCQSLNQPGLEPRHSNTNHTKVTFANKVHEDVPFISGKMAKQVRPNRELRA
jgi:hypothetical protein